MIETGYYRIQLSMQLQPARIRVEGTLVNFAGEPLCRVLRPGTWVNFCWVCAAGLSAPYPIWKNM